LTGIDKVALSTLEKKVADVERAHGNVDIRGRNV
jgi:hypothetical protein